MTNDEYNNNKKQKDVSCIFLARKFRNNLVKKTHKKGHYSTTHTTHAQPLNKVRIKKSKKNRLLKHETKEKTIFTKCQFSYPHELCKIPIYKLCLF